MDDVVLVAVLQRTPDLPRKLPGDPFTESSMGDDIIEHLPTRDVLEDHVVVMLVDDHLPHPTDVRVVEEHTERGFPNRTDFLGMFLCCHFGQKRGCGRGCTWGRGWRARGPRYDFDRQLNEQTG